jgi:hypothetical protein
MKNSTWLNIWAVVTFLGGVVEIVFAGTGFAFVMCAMLTSGSAVCKAIEKAAA